MDIDCQAEQCAPQDQEVCGVLVAFDLNEGTLEIYVRGPWPDINRTVHFRQDQRPLVVAAGMSIGGSASAIVREQDDEKLWLVGIQSKMTEDVVLHPLGDTAQPALFASN